MEKKQTVWLGDFENIEFVIPGDPIQYRAVIVHAIKRIDEMTEDEADAAIGPEYDGYLFPDLYDGEIFYRRATK